MVYKRINPYERGIESDSEGFYKCPMCGKRYIPCCPVKQYAYKYERFGHLLMFDKWSCMHKYQQMCDQKAIDNRRAGGVKRAEQRKQKANDKCKKCIYDKYDCQNADNSIKCEHYKEKA